MINFDVSTSSKASSGWLWTCLLKAISLSISNRDRSIKSSISLLFFVSLIFIQLMGLFRLRTVLTSSAAISKSNKNLEFRFFSLFELESDALLKIPAVDRIFADFQ